ncbi:hypothetical protein BX600DRAFT_429895 [Xylariales sp. PMI_506]|nr:hypothetical protein BX600DRAFT_429895 [Xylariales sp. PMI_506]
MVHSEEDKYSFKSYFRRHGCAVLVQNGSFPDHFAPEVIPARIDYKVAKKWLSFCKEFHQAGSQKKEILGIANDYDDEGKLPNSLAPTIEDAIKIRQMESIYHNSEFTIIAAAGNDESHGLPGVGTRYRSDQPMVHFEGNTILWIPKDPRESIKSSRLYTRGWTYQEEFLSRRRLIFTEEQVYFECNNMSCSESTHYNLDSIHSTNKSKPQRWLAPGLFNPIRFQDWDKNQLDEISDDDAFDTYLRVVEEYSKRRLTLDKDALNAYHGICKWLSLIRCYGDTKNCWDSSGAPRRRSGFPSWSWAAWDGEVKYDSNPKSLYACVQQIEVEDASGTWHYLGSVNPSASVKRKLLALRFQAQLFRVPFVWYDPAYPVGKRCRFGTSKTELYLSDGPASESQFAREAQDKRKWAFLALFNGNDTSRSAVLILRFQKESKTWIRAGLLLMDAIIRPNSRAKTFIVT